MCEVVVCEAPQTSFSANTQRIFVLRDAVRLTVGREALLDALQKSSFGQGRVLKEMIPNTVFPGAFDTVNFALTLLRKDVALATELGREYHVPMMIAALAEQQLEEAMRRGWGHRDSNTLFCLQEERAGIQLRSSKA